MRRGLPHLVELGVDALWLSPFYLSPMADGGYDVADPCDVDPIFGTLADFDELVATAHAAGCGSPSTSCPTTSPTSTRGSRPRSPRDRAARSGSGSSSATGRGADGELPPNNWPSLFGGPAWQRVPDGQWYLHLFAPEQPDLNWANPQVPAEFARILRFWLDRGRRRIPHRRRPRDGQAAGPARHGSDRLERAAERSVPRDDLRWDQDGVHEYLRGFRSVIDAYPGDRMAVGEVWVPMTPGWRAMCVRTS